MKKLLIITTNFPPSISIGTQRIIRICKYLDPAEWRISILTLKESYYAVSRDRKDDRNAVVLERVRVYRTHKLDVVKFLLDLRERLRGKSSAPAAATSASNGAPAQKPAQDSAAKGAFVAQTARRSAWSRFKDFWTDLFQFPDKNITWFPLAVWRGWRLIRRENIDAIYSSSPPHSLHLISTFLKVLTGKKLIIDFRDPWARSPWHEEIRDLDRFERWKADRITRFEKWAVRKADEVVLITREMRNDYVNAYPDQPADKFRFFPNGYDPEDLALSEQQKSEAPPMEKPARVTFIHAGSLYKYRDPTPILEALRQLVDNGKLTREDVHFLFIGGITPDLRHIPEQAKEMGLEDLVTFIPPVSYTKVMEYMVNSDIPILLQPVTRLQLPGKFFDYLCLGKPIFAVAELESATEKMVKEGFGIFVNYNMVDEIAEGILFLAQHPQHNMETFLKKRSDFDVSQSIRQFQKILEA